MTGARRWAKPLALRSLAPALVLAGGLLAAGCGIPLSGAAQPLPRAQVPASLLRPPPSTTTTTVPDKPNSVPIAVYFLNSDLTRLVKTTADEQPPANVAEALGLLTYGPTAADSKLGYQTALSTSPQANASVKFNHLTGVADVTIDDATELLFGVQLYEALAQIVYTVTDPQFGLHSVVFTWAGSDFPAYLPNGTLTYSPVTRADYAQLAPGPAQPTTTTTTTPLAPGTRDLGHR